VVKIFDKTCLYLCILFSMFTVECSVDYLLVGVFILLADVFIFSCVIYAPINKTD